MRGTSGMCVCVGGTKRPQTGTQWRPAARQGMQRGERGVRYAGAAQAANGMRCALGAARPSARACACPSSVVSTCEPHDAHQGAHEAACLLTGRHGCRTSASPASLTSLRCPGQRQSIPSGRERPQSPFPRPRTHTTMLHTRKASPHAPRCTATAAPARPPPARPRRRLPASPPACLRV